MRLAAGHAAIGTGPGLAQARRHRERAGGGNGAEPNSVPTFTAILTSGAQEVARDGGSAVELFGRFQEVSPEAQGVLLRQHRYGAGDLADRVSGGAFARAVELRAEFGEEFRRGRVIGVEATAGGLKTDGPGIGFGSELRQHATPMRVTRRYSQGMQRSQNIGGDNGILFEPETLIEEVGAARSANGGEEMGGGGARLRVRIGTEPLAEQRFGSTDLVGQGEVGGSRPTPKRLQQAQILKPARLLRRGQAQDFGQDTGRCLVGEQGILEAGKVGAPTGSGRGILRQRAKQYGGIRTRRVRGRRPGYIAHSEAIERRGSRKYTCRCR